MIKFEHTEVHGFEAAIRGMRNPHASWDRIDSNWSFGSTLNQIFITIKDMFKAGTCDPRKIFKFVIGENDLKLMQNLAKAGTDHAKYLRYIVVTVDITAPLYWWKESDTYKVATVSDSCSTMHTIHKDELELDNLSTEHLSDHSINDLLNTIDVINDYRERFLKTGDKDYWWQMIQLLPTSFNQRRTMQFNYQNLYAMYRSRKGHKLDEWHDFRRWVESLPYFLEIFNIPEEEREGR